MLYEPVIQKKKKKTCFACICLIFQRTVGIRTRQHNSVPCEIYTTAFALKFALLVKGVNTLAFGTYTIRNTFSPVLKTLSWLIFLIKALRVLMGANLKLQSGKTHIQKKKKMSSHGHALYFIFAFALSVIILT